MRKPCIAKWVRYVATRSAAAACCGSGSSRATAAVSSASVRLPSISASRRERHRIVQLQRFVAQVGQDPAARGLPAHVRACLRPLGRAGRQRRGVRVKLGGARIAGLGEQRFERTRTGASGDRVRALPRANLVDRNDARRLADEPLQHGARGAHAGIVGFGRAGEGLALGGRPHQRHRRGHVHRAHARLDVHAGHRRVGMADERLPETAELGKVQILLTREAIHAHHVLLHPRRETGGGHHRQLGLGEKGELVAMQRRGELVEVERLVDLRQVIVKQRAVGLQRQFPEFVAQHAIGFGLGDARFGEQAGQRPRRVELRAGIGEAIDVVMQHAPGGFAHMAARVSVVADEHDSVAREARSGQREQALAHLGRNPRIEAVGGDVVEAAQRLRQRWRCPAART